MIKKFILALSLLALFSTPAIAETTKREGVAIALKALNEVYTLSGKYGADIKHDPDTPNGMKTFKRFDKHFEDYLQRITNPFALKEISVLCFYVLMSDEAGDESLDDYFERCSTEAMWRLAKIKGKDAREQLIDIARLVHPFDGGFAEDFDDAIAMQNKLNGLAPPPRPFDPFLTAPPTANIEKK